MIYKYIEGNGFENHHTDCYIHTHDKSKDGKECGCKFCKELENGFWNILPTKLKRLSGQKTFTQNYHIINERNINGN